MSSNPPGQNVSPSFHNKIQCRQTTVFQNSSYHPPVDKRLKSLLASGFVIDKCQTKANISWANWCREDRDLMTLRSLCEYPTKGLLQTKLQDLQDNSGCKISVVWVHSDANVADDVVRTAAMEQKNHCKSCGGRPMGQKTRVRVIWSRRKKKDREVPCKFCNRRFASEMALEQHTKDRHGAAESGN
ncbi:OLC1v1037681C1 [Oldenlandia corymbosa var. corymbosa]|uniref:OLC1v1037681C1 n=1 Tax=Oldenlandia corymbosa var. corymbosa TaxID=529605 RepID=A0AAV1CY26_OLDCO|nr:OLC1v1037681C1 [Oldenlandia corymbosa var. corymbosa]